MRITIPLYKSLKEIAEQDGVLYHVAIKRIHTGEYVAFQIPRKQKIWKNGVPELTTKMVTGYIRKSDLIKIIYNILSDDGNKANNLKEKDPGKKKARKKASSKAES